MDRDKWLAQTADALEAGKFDYACVTEDWQRAALQRACPTDGDELHEAAPSKLRDQIGEND